jgi:hypothetical protein
MRQDIDRITTSHSDDPTASQETRQRYTIHEAALLLGLSVDAVRKGRNEEALSEREKDPDGTVYIVLDIDQSETGQKTSQSSTKDDIENSQLVDSPQDQVEYPRRELDIRNEELRRKDHLLAAALERIPELEAPRESRDTRETASEALGAGRGGRSVR